MEVSWKDSLIFILITVLFVWCSVLTFRQLQLVRVLDLAANIISEIVENQEAIVGLIRSVL